MMPRPATAAQPDTLPLFHGPADRVVLWSAQGPVSLGEFSARAAGLARTLRGAHHVINLCEDRGAFLTGFAAALLAGASTLLPPSRAPQVVAEIAREYADPPRIDDATVAAAEPAEPSLAARLPADFVAAIGCTSGSTGLPQRHAKRWGAFAGSNGWNATTIRALLPTGAAAQVLATVPPQHMYGMELSVLLPIAADFAVHVARPLFPADVAAALADLTGPRVLVTTPVHLRALLAEPRPLPALSAIVCATAPLEAATARAAEQRFGAPLLELFGSTETCVIARRRTACEDAWTPYPGITLARQPEGTGVHAPWFDAPVLLQDQLDLEDGGRFTVRGRSQDMVEIAGKRASLAELTRRLLAIDGVEDAVVLQPEREAGIARLAALVVAPTREPAEILDALRPQVDPAFMPRPLKCVPALPRNEVGKLPREALLALLAGA